jgi:hypothetical protein
MFALSGRDQKPSGGATEAEGVITISHTSKKKPGATDYECERGKDSEKNPCADPDTGAPQTPQGSSTEVVDGFLCISEVSGKVMAPCQNKCSSTKKDCGREGDPKLSAKGAYRAHHFLERQAENENERKEEPDDCSNGQPCISECFHGCWFEFTLPDNSREMVIWRGSFGAKEAQGIVKIFDFRFWILDLANGKEFYD